ncbi:MAG: hypothetical protein DHS20C17_24700 [Cyclobacteriaceae bacterium]|nr:MAG: hypothetical protein DHS20C17_24700 [Cyclobacteriaceae bacterium]
MDQRIATVLNHVEDHLGSVVKLKDMAQLACMSVSQFHRLFKKETGTTPFKFIEKLRISKAHHLMLSKNVSVQYLATKLGYNDYETFTRAFKKHYYLAPDDFKTVAEEIRSYFEAGEELKLMFITAEENSTEEEIKNKLKATLKKKGISIDEVPARSFIVRRVTDTPSRGLPTKEKYNIVQDQKIWSTLINQDL